MSSRPFTSSLLVSLSLVLCSSLVTAQESAADEEARRYGTIGALTGAALGANDPMTQPESLESNFFDRRVVLRVRSEQSALLSNNP